MSSTVEAGLHWTARRIVRIVTDYLGLFEICFHAVWCYKQEEESEYFWNLLRLPKGSGAHGRAVPAGGQGRGGALLASTRGRRQKRQHQDIVDQQLKHQHHGIIHHQPKNQYQRMNFQHQCITERVIPHQHQCITQHPHNLPRPGLSVCPLLTLHHCRL